MILTLLSGKKTINKEGRTVAITSPQVKNQTIEREDRLYPELVNHLGLNWELATNGAIIPALEQIMLEHDLGVNDFEKFIIHTPLIRPGHESLFLQGILFGFKEKWDLCGSILIPQFEDSLRYLLTQRGILTSSIEDNSTQEERSINTFFNNYPEELKKIFGKDIFYELKALLVRDKNGHGFNLRNLVCHGLISKNEFYTSSMVYFWWLFFRLTAVPLIKAWSEKNKEK